MNKPRNRRNNRKLISLRVDEQTFEAIRRLATERNLSQSEVVDQAVALFIEVEESMKEEQS